MKNKRNLTIIILIFILAALTRLLPFNTVFTDNSVQLKGADAYYFVRHSSVIKEQGFVSKDNYLCFSDGLNLDNSSSFYQIILLVFSYIMPIEVVTAILSPILALAFLYIIYLLAKEIFKEDEFSIITTVSIAGLTGIQFIGRSYIGFGDRHVLEVFLFTALLYFLIKSINTKSRKYIVFACISAILYSFSWSQSSLMMSLLTLGVISILIFSKHKDIELKDFAIATLPPIISPILHGLVFQNIQVMGLSLINTFLLLISIYVFKKFNNWSIRIGVISLSIIILAVIINFLFPQLFELVSYILNGFLIGNTSGPIVSEAQPLLSIYSDFSLLNSGTIQLIFIFLSLIGCYFAFKDKQYLIVFLNIALFFITLKRIRTEYYLLIPMCFTIAYLAKQKNWLKYTVILLVLVFYLLYSVSWISTLNNDKSSLAFSSSDYKMANWIKENIHNDDAVLLADWQTGYMYTYVADKKTVAEPNFCNSIKPIEFLMFKNEDDAYKYVKNIGANYVITKPFTINHYYYYLMQLNKTNEFNGFSNVDDGKQQIYLDQSYYERMGSRLYTFDGEKVLAKKVYVLKDENIIEYDDIEEASANGFNVYYSNPESTPSVNLYKLKHFELIKTFEDKSGGTKLFKVID